MNKYYIKINKYNEIIKPYSDEDGLIITSDFVEVDKEIISEYLKNKNKGLLVKFINGELITDNLNNSSEYVKNLKINLIINLLNKTDKTQLLDSRLSIEKQEEFAIFRQELRIILGELKNGFNPFDLIIPNEPEYE